MDSRAHRPPTVPAACCTEIPPSLCQVAFVLDELSRPRAAALLVSRALLLLIYMARPRRLAPRTPHPPPVNFTHNQPPTRPWDPERKPRPSSLKPSPPFFVFVLNELRNGFEHDF